MSVCVYSVFVLSCVQVAALLGLMPRPRSPTDCKRSRNRKNGQGPAKGCRAIDRSPDSYAENTPFKCRLF
jgi:hypothetical protein